MSTRVRSGAELICDALRAAGIEHVFGVPGSQNLALYEALRTSGLRTVIATHEHSAAMMAIGHYRASGRMAALVTIPGPGFTWALTGLAEAFLDSAALLHIVGLPADAPGTRYQLQAIDQAAIARPIAKAVYQVDHAHDMLATIATAHAQALRGEPGPVLVQVANKALSERPPTSSPAAACTAAPAAIDPASVTEVARTLQAATRCVIFAGQGSHAAAVNVQRLAENLSAAVVTTTSGRGVVAEDHRLSLAFALGDTQTETLNDLIATSDCVLAIGCKFSHNGSRGFTVKIDADKLIHVDASKAVLGANYPAHLALQADAKTFTAAVLRELDIQPPHAGGFAEHELAQLRRRGRAQAVAQCVEPKIHGVPGNTPEALFAALRQAMPRNACLVTDSGLHQTLVRRHFPVLCPRGLLIPSNLQSMGFAVGSATGAAVADPQRVVVAVVGDGGLAMSGLELLTAVRERVNLTVIVFVDDAYGLIRLQQLARTGHAFGTQFSGMDIAALAKAVDAQHMRLRDNPEQVLRAAIESPGVTIVEVAVGDSLPMRWMHAKSLARTTLGDATRSRLRRWLRRR